MRRFALLAVAAMLASDCGPIIAQTWSHRMGGAGLDRAAAVVRTHDGGYVVAGATSSTGAGGFDGLLVRTDPCGSVLWQYAYGGSGDDRFAAIASTVDGFVLVGDTDSFDTHSRAWIVRVNETGAVIWQHRYDGASARAAHGVASLVDGGVAFVGEVEGDSPGQRDGLVVVLDADGTVRWARVLGTPADESLRAIAVSAGGDLIAAGSTARDDGLYDTWVARLDIAGNPIWQNAYGSEGDDAAEAVVGMTEGALVAGFSDSGDARLFDQWVAAIDALGSVVWQWRIGAAADDRATALAENASGRIAVAGDSSTATTAAAAGLFSLLDGAGTPLSHRRYALIGDRYVGGLAATRGGWFVTGTSDDSGDHDLWLHAVDGTGRQFGGCLSEGGGADVQGAPGTLERRVTDGHAVATGATVTTSAVRSVATLNLVIDCALVPGEISPPGAIPLRFASATRLSWEPAGLHCAETFDVYAGDLATVATGEGAECRVNALPVPETDILAVPEPGQGRYYLVGGRTANGSGTLGATSTGEERTRSVPCSR